MAATNSNPFMIEVMPAGTVPSWYPGVGEIVELNSGTTIRGTAQAAGAGQFPGTDDANLCAPWSGGALVTVGGQPYLCAMGGGHSDGAWNGIVKYGPLTGPGSDTPSWSIFLAASNLSDVVSNAPVYADGRIPACHHYNELVGVGDRLYVMAPTATYGGSAPEYPRAYYFTPGGQTRIADNIATQLSGACAHANGKIYYRGTTASDWGKLVVHDIASNGWSSEPNADIVATQDNAMAADTTRGKIYTTDGVDGVCYDATTLARTTGRAVPSNLTWSIEYDPDRDAFVSWVSASRTVYELNAAALATGGDPAWTSRSFSGATPAAAVPAGTFGRFRYVPQLRGYIVAPNSDSHVYFYRSA